MEQLNKITDRVLAEARENPSLKPQLTSSQLSVAENFSDRAKTEIVTQLGACLAVQRTYGKQAADLSAVARIFMSDLAGYTGGEVVEALIDWRKKSPEFPTPADIEGLLNPQPVFDKAVYLQFVKRKERGELNEYSAGYSYIKAYEKHVMGGHDFT